MTVGAWALALAQAAARWIIPAAEDSPPCSRTRLARSSRAWPEQDQRLCRS
jgi:hypothetical protein